MHHALLKPPLPAGKKPILWSNLHGAALGLAIAESAQEHDGLLLVVMENPRQLQILETEIRFFLNHKAEIENSLSDSITPSSTALSGEIDILHFPNWECLPYDVFSPHQDITSDRLRLLASLKETRRGILLTTSENLGQRLPPVDFILGHSFSIRVGQSVEIEHLRERLTSANYVSVSQVLSPGEFAVRGGLIDVFPSGAEAPFRLDMFDDEVESIRFFDPDTQRSSGKTDRIELLPAREFPMNESGIKQFRQAFRKQFEGDPRKQTIYNEISEGNTPAGTEFFFPLFFEETATLFDYLPAHSLFLYENEFLEQSRARWAEIKDRYTNANYDTSRKVLPPETLYLNPDQLLAELSQYQRIQHLPGNHDKADWVASSKPGRQLPVNPKEESPYSLFLKHISDSQHKVLIATETAGRREAMEGMLMNHDQIAIGCEQFIDFLAEDESPAICVAPLERGLHLPDLGIEIITESQLYGEKVFQRRRRSNQAQDPASMIRSLAELSEGDPVVHLEHGVGRYIGLQNLDIYGEETEFLVISYQDNDKLFVPILSLNQISRYVGGAPETAPLHKLGSEQWQKAKKKAKEKAYDVAAELLEIEALRNARQGQAMPVDEEDYRLFTSRFPFEETADQERAIEEVLADLSSEEPMDRLVCGDVGFGKTEVALRAAYVAVQNKKQVAMLVPTTLLAQQHYQSFVDRFADMAVSVELLSRFRSKKESDAVIAAMKVGQPDIVIGTHKLLQDDISFRDLGLLIIDEEQRFGVRQKEKIKRLRSQVDILTLTATPIPRTLNLAMSGLRSISIIATPPSSRLSIKTFVRDWNKGLIREACLREIRRGGQVYFLHNNVRTIEQTVEELRELIPEAEINFGHGQMAELQLERVMQDFYHQRFNILVCSTIIESGIDIPSANTIIINRADKFGLAQLHQLRGRVGRSHHQAYAYLLVPEMKLITSDARKRLNAIDSMEDLGAGFALASHDLEIRGAGELLGETQSGSIDDVGFSLYSEYLAMAVKSIRENKLPEKMDASDLATSVELHVPALFPESYLGNTHTRLMLYKRISSALNESELEELQIETIDRFGLLPDAGKNLFRLTAMRLVAEKIGVKKLDVGEQGGQIEFHDQLNIDPSAIIGLIQRNPHDYQLAGPSALKIKAEYPEPDERIQACEKLLDQLASDFELVA
ncbi:MAG: transcription-repair coupling factor [Acidiferrobacterales bacterium]|nr:transcription-repair coupling factor [Acidiferrobacterales bacterium]